MDVTVDHLGTEHRSFGSHPDANAPLITVDPTPHIINDTDPVDLPPANVQDEEVAEAPVEATDTPAEEALDPIAEDVPQDAPQAQQ
jgi:hypothetical protein